VKHRNSSVIFIISPPHQLFISQLPVNFSSPIFCFKVRSLHTVSAFMLIYFMLLTIWRLPMTRITCITSVSTSQRTQSLSITKTNHLMQC